MNHDADAVSSLAVISSSSLANKGLQTLGVPAPLGEAGSTPVAGVAIIVPKPTLFSHIEIISYSDCQLYLPTHNQDNRGLYL